MLQNFPCILLTLKYKIPLTPLRVVCYRFDLYAHLMPMV